MLLRPARSDAAVRTSFRCGDDDGNRRIVVALKAVSTDGAATLCAVSCEPTPLEPLWRPSPAAREWLRRHPEVLPAIFAAFETDGAWPDPVELDRRLRAEGRKLGIGRALDELPPELGHRQGWPRAIELSWFGLGSIEAARQLLDQIVLSLRMAVRSTTTPPGLLCSQGRRSLHALGSRRRPWTVCLCSWLPPATRSRGRPEQPRCMGDDDRPSDR